MQLPNMTTIGAKIARLFNLFIKYISTGHPIRQVFGGAVLMVLMVLGFMMAVALLGILFGLMFEYPLFFLCMMGGGIAVMLLNFYYWVKDQPDE